VHSALQQATRSGGHRTRAGWKRRQEEDSALERTLVLHQQPTFTTIIIMQQVLHEQLQRVRQPSTEQKQIIHYQGGLKQRPGPLAVA
jgi:hypothetical protein